MTVVIPFRTSLAAEPEALEAGIVMHLDGTLWWLKPDGTQVQLGVGGGGGGESFNGGTITEPLIVDVPGGQAFVAGDNAETGHAIYVRGDADGAQATLEVFGSNEAGNLFKATTLDGDLFVVGPTGHVTISPSDFSPGLTITGPTGSFDAATTLFDVWNDEPTQLFAITSIGAVIIQLKASEAAFILSDGDNDLFTVGPTGNLGFFGNAPTAKPTGVAVSAPGIHAALVTLGLIAA